MLICSRALFAAIHVAPLWHTPASICSSTLRAVHYHGTMVCDSEAKYVTTPWLCVARFRVVADVLAVEGLVTPPKQIMDGCSCWGAAKE